MKKPSPSPRSRLPPLQEPRDTQRPTSARSNAASLPKSYPLDGTADDVHRIDHVRIQAPRSSTTAATSSAFPTDKVSTRASLVSSTQCPRFHQTNGSHGDRFPDRQRQQRFHPRQPGRQSPASHGSRPSREQPHGVSRAGQSDTPPTDNDTASTRSASTDFTSTGSPSDARCSVDEFSVISGHLVYAEVPTSVSAVATL
jgi:hypothetical protein